MRKLFVVVSLSIFWYNARCGVHKPTQEKKERITNGTISLMTFYPFVVSIVYHGSHKCGGSIISNMWILTAAHCCYYNGEEVVDSFIQISVGNVYWKDGDYYRVQKKFVHESYDAAKVTNDIALLKVKTSIKFGLSVAPIALHPLKINESSENPQAVVMGWGAYTDVEGRLISMPSDELQHVDVQVVPLQDCMKYYSDISSNNICVFEGDAKGSCQGDSGGPLVMRINKLVQIGIVSYGADCSNTIPEVYTSVYAFYSWIKEVMRRDRPMGRRRTSANRNKN